MIGPSRGAYNPSLYSAPQGSLYQLPQPPTHAPGTPSYGAGATMNSTAAHLRSTGPRAVSWEERIEAQMVEAALKRRNEAVGHHYIVTHAAACHCFRNLKKPSLLISSFPHPSLRLSPFPHSSLPGPDLSLVAPTRSSAANSAPATTSGHGRCERWACGGSHAYSQGRRRNGGMALARPRQTLSCLTRR